MISNLKKQIHQLKGERAILLSDQAREESNRLTAKKKEHQWSRAQKILTELGLKTQQQLEFHVGNLTTMALEAVFTNPYEVEIKFEQRRNQTECDIWFLRDGERRDPMHSSGLGAVDVASFALRVATWSMQSPKTRNLLILDEPFKHLKGAEENKRALQMIKEISDKLGLQIITVSDERTPIEEIEKGADKVFHVGIKNGVSKIN